MPSRSEYDASRVDWARLRKFACRVARETKVPLAPPLTYEPVGDGRETVEVLGPHWRLDSRRYYSEASTSNYERVEESLERVVFALLPDGSLKRAVIIKFVVAVRYPNDESYSNHHVQDLDSDDIALFDFSQDDYRGKVSGSLRGEYVNNTVPGKRLLAHAKGVGLSLALKKLLT